MNIHTLTVEAENDDHCQHIYFKSLLFLVSNALEARHRIPVIRPKGEPILGLEHFLDELAEQALKELVTDGRFTHILSPNQIPVGDAHAARSTHHGDFDNDTAIWKGLISDIC